MTLLHAGLVTLEEMKERRENLVREREKQIAAKLPTSEAKRTCDVAHPAPLLGRLITRWSGYETIFFVSITDPPDLDYPFCNKLYSCVFLSSNFRSPYYNLEVFFLHCASMEDDVTSTAGSLVWELTTSHGPIPEPTPVLIASGRSIH